MRFRKEGQSYYIRLEVIEIKGREQGFKPETKEEANVRQKEAKIKHNHTFPE